MQQQTFEITYQHYMPSERRALLNHKYFLGIERGYDPPITEAIESWESRFARDWRTRKMRRDAEVQIREIERYRQRLSAERGVDVSFHEAARLWVDKCECAWRLRWETDPRSDV